MNRLLIIEVTNTDLIHSPEGLWEWLTDKGYEVESITNRPKSYKWKDRTSDET